ncbi:hypothetical protein TNCV_1582771 [Trichonephila clavipes]|nr:hypothetical protein TNCV_1582771 [Trichonephila clavipes]
MASCHCLGNATRWQIVGRLEVGQSEAICYSDFGVLRKWYPLGGNSSQREEQRSINLVKAAKGQQLPLKTVI